MPEVNPPPPEERIDETPQTRRRRRELDNRRLLTPALGRAAAAMAARIEEYHTVYRAAIQAVLDLSLLATILHDLLPRAGRIGGEITAASLEADRIASLLEDAVAAVGVAESWVDLIPRPPQGG